MINKLILFMALVFISKINLAGAKNSCIELYEDHNIVKSRNYLGKEFVKLGLSGAAVAGGSIITSVGGSIPTHLFMGSGFAIGVDLFSGTTTGVKSLNWGAQLLNDNRLYNIVKSSISYLNNNESSDSEKFKKFFSKHNLYDEGLLMNEAALAIYQFNNANLGLCHLFEEMDKDIPTYISKNPLLFIFYPEKSFIKNLKNSLWAQKEMYSKIFLEGLSNDIQENDLKKQDHNNEYIKEIALSAIEFLNDKRKAGRRFHKFYKKYNFEYDGITENDVALAVKKNYNIYASLNKLINKSEKYRDYIPSFNELSNIFQSEELFVKSLKKSFLGNKEETYLDQYQDQQILKSKNLYNQEVLKFAIDLSGIAIGGIVTGLTAGGSLPPLIIGSVAIIGTDVGLGVTTYVEIASWRKQKNNDEKMFKLIRSTKKYLKDSSRGKSLKEFMRRHRLDEEGFSLKDVANTISKFNDKRLGMGHILNNEYGSVTELTSNIKPIFIFYPENVFVNILKNEIRNNYSDMMETLKGNSIIMDQGFQ